MVFFNYALRKLNAKIVYYGPGLCGKTTNLAWIHDHFEGGSKGKMISLATEGDRTIFFDLLPLEIGSIRGMDVTLQLYTVPGQVHYNSTRQLVLRGADGVVFVADSQRAMKSSNIDSFKNLQENLLLQGISLDGFPLALQFNKRDLRDILTVEELNEDLNRYLVPIFEGVATEGVGVQETLEGIVKLVMRSLRERYEGATGPKAPGAEEAPRPAAAPPTARPPEGRPVTPPTPSVPKPPPVQPVKPPADTPKPEPPQRAEASRPAEPGPPAAGPADDVFSNDLGARTHDFSKTRRGLEGVPPRRRTGFEDEVSTDVYEVGDDEPFAEIPSDPGFSAPSAAPPPVGEVRLPETPPEPEIEVVMPEEDIASPDIRPGAPPPFPAEAQEPPWPEPEPAVTPSGPTASPEPGPRAEDRIEPRYEDRIEAPSPFVAGPGDEHELSPELFESLAGRPSKLDAAKQPAADYEAIEAAVAAADEADGEGDEPVIFEEDEGDGQPIVLSGFDPFAESEVIQIHDPRRAAAAPRRPVYDPEPEPLPPAPEPSQEPEPLPPEPPGYDHDAAVESEPAALELPAVDDGIELEFDLDEDGDDTAPSAPFEQPAPPPPEPAPAAAIEASRREVDVRAEDNQLHLRLQGTGAIVDSGQVRALDIEVPVPGSWVGNRRVTLQLRLTLTPDTEDGNDGPTGSS